MTLPLVTTTLLVERPDLTGDGALPRAYTTVGTYDGVVSAPSGSDRRVGGDQMTITAVAYLDEGSDVRRYDRITDQTNLQVYEVVWVSTRYELGLGHVKAGLTHTEGAASG